MPHIVKEASYFSCQVDDMRRAILFKDLFGGRRIPIQNVGGNVNAGDLLFEIQLLQIAIFGAQEDKLFVGSRVLSSYFLDGFTN